MEFKGIGMTCHGPSLEGNLEKKFEARLSDFQKKSESITLNCLSRIGYHFKRKVQFVQIGQNIGHFKKKFDFNYAVHPFNDLNLFDTEGLDKQREIFLRNLEFAYMVGAEVLVYHAGVRLPQDEHRPMDELLEIEREELYRLGRRPKSWESTLPLKTRILL